MALAADSLNGLWIARMIQRSQAFARHASRLFAAGVAGIALVVAGLGAMRLAWPATDAWSGAHALCLGSAVLLLAFATFLAARAIAKPRVPGTGLWSADRSQRR